MTPHDRTRPVPSVVCCYLDHRFCLDFFYEPAYSADEDAPESNQEHHLSTCYEKYAESGTNLWGYYRRATWTNAVAASSSIAPQIIDFSARTQPWNGDGDVDRMVDWAPVSPETNCTPGATLTIGAESVSLKFPSSDCDETWVDAIATQGKMGVIFEGTTPRQKTLDYAMLFEANTSYDVPTLADYAWAEVRHRGPQGVTQTDITLWRDSGWIEW